VAEVVHLWDPAQESLANRVRRALNMLELATGMSEGPITLAVAREVALMPQLPKGVQGRAKADLHEIWLAETREEMGEVHLGAQLFDEGRRMLKEDYARVKLPHDVAPGQSIRLRCALPPLLQPGAYLIELDMVDTLERQEVSRLAARGHVCPPIHPITGRPSLPPASLTGSALSLACARATLGTYALHRPRERGRLTTFREFHPQVGVGCLCTPGDMARVSADR
jgi:hypothetical protein